MDFHDKFQLIKINEIIFLSEMNQEPNIQLMFMKILITLKRKIYIFIPILLKHKQMYLHIIFFLKQVFKL